MTPTTVPVTNLGDLIEPYLASQRAAGLRPATISFYETGLRQLNAFLAREGRALDVEAISPSDIEAWLVERRAVSAANGKSSYNEVRPAFGWFVERGYATQTPFAKVRRPRASTPTMSVPSAEDVERLVGACGSPRERAVITLLVESGLRRSEIVRLTLADVDLVNGRLAVRAPKNGHDRVAAFGDQSRRALRLWLRDRDATIRRRNVVDPGWLFINASARPILPNGLHTAVARVARRAGVSVAPHALRRYAVSSWLEADISPLDVSFLAGHSLEMVARYSRARGSERSLGRWVSPFDAPAKRGVA